MAKIENEHLVIQIDHAEGTTIRDIQKALILGIEKISESESSGYEDHKSAVYWLSTILRECLLDESQTNIGLGRKAYKDPKPSKENAI